MAAFKNLLIQILELSERGYTPAEISQLLQIGRSVVEDALEMHGVVDA